MRWPPCWDCGQAVMVVQAGRLTCPACGYTVGRSSDGAAVGVVNGDESTSHYVPAITEEMVVAAARALGYSGHALNTTTVRDQVRAALAAAVESPRKRGSHD